MAREDHLKVHDRRRALRIALVGPVPPPIGGVSVHVSRLAGCLESLGHDVVVVSGVRRGNAREMPLRRFWIGDLLWEGLIGARWDVLHLHVSGWGRLRWLVPVLLLLQRRAKLVVTLHSGSWPRPERVSGAMRDRLPWRLVAGSDLVICVNEMQRQALVGQRGVPENRVVVLPAFIAAPAEAMRDDCATVVARLRASGRRIVVSSGYGTRLYRYDDIIQALTEDGMRGTALVMALYGERDAGYLRELRGMVGDRDVSFVEDLSPGEFLGLLNASDVYVRATDRDGDAVAVREAMALGLEVICSDAVPRPPGVALYPVGNVTALRDTLARAVARDLGRAGSADPPDTPCRKNEELYYRVVATPR